MQIVCYCTNVLNSFVLINMHVMPTLAQNALVPFNHKTCSKIDVFFDISSINGVLFPKFLYPNND